MNTLFMAFASGKESTEAGEIKRYIGVAPVTILAVNPNKAKLEELYGTTLEKEPEYVSMVERDGKSVQNVRISFIVRTAADKCDGIDMTSQVTFFLQNAPRMGSQSGKYQIIDKYGRTAWATKEDIDAKRIPQYANGPAQIDADYRPAYVGEEELTNFIKAYLNIPEVRLYQNGTWVANPHPEECEARLDNVKNYFTGDVKELDGIIKLQPNNKVKVLFGVRSAEGGKEYQAVYTRMFLRNNARDFSRLDKDLKEAKNAGAYSTTTFEVVPIKEYVVTPTNLEEEAKPSTSWFDV